MERHSWSRNIVLVLLLGVFLAPRRADCLRFAVIGDSRPHYDDIFTQPAVFGKMLKDMEAQEPRPAFLLHTGDIILGWSWNEGVLRKEYERYREAVKGVPFPIYIALGNHEGFSGQCVSMFRKYFGPTWYSFDREGYHFVILDNSAAGHYLKLGDEQEAWLKKDLEGNKGKKGTFVAMHVPIVGDEMELWLEIDAADRDRLHKLFLANNVKAVFQGHKHIYELCVRDGIKYVTTGGGGAPVMDWPPVGTFFHYIIVDADEGYLSIMLRKADAIDAEDQEKAKEAAAPPAVKVERRQVLDGFERGNLSSMIFYNNFVKITSETGKVTEGKGSAKFAFDFAVSLWPMLGRDSSTPWNLSGVEGIAVDVWAAPSLAMKDETAKVALAAGDIGTEPMPLKPGEWVTLKWRFADAVWKDKEHHKKEKKGPEAFPSDALKNVGGYSLNLASEPAGERQDWERRMKGYIILDNLRTF